MKRRIVLIRGNGPLEEAWHERSFGPAGPHLNDRLKVAGGSFDEAYHPVRMRRHGGVGNGLPPASGFNYGSVGPAEAHVGPTPGDDQDAIEGLRRERLGEIVGVFADP